MAPSLSLPTGTDPVPPTILQSSDLVASLPAPFLRLIVLFAKPIALFRTALEVLSWRGGRRVQSWMVVGAWWGLCLGAGHAFMYLLPPLIFLPLLPLSRLRLKSSAKEPPRNTPSEPSTSETLLVTLADLNAIYALLPPSPLPTTSSVYARFRQLGPIRLVRGLLVLWAVWISLGHTVGYRTLLAVLGSILLLLPSPPLAHLVNLLSKSLFFRRGLALAFLFTFGSPPESSYHISISHFSPLGWVKSKWTASRRPSLAFSFRPRMSQPAPSGSALDDAEEGEEKVENPIYFRFEVHENQRWWMGLDWTSALLPQERPSWCDLHLQPVSPPASFTLPAPTSVVIPTPTPTDPKAKVLRTATWKWLDDDWSIVRAGPGLAANPNANANANAATQVVSPAVPDGDDHDHAVNSTQSQSSTGPGTSAPSSQAQANSRPSSFISPFGSSPPKPSSIEETNPSAGARAQSIAEQAFTKGLERLKARTASVATSSISTAAGPTSPRKSVDSTRQRTGSQASEDALSYQGPDDGSGQAQTQSQSLSQVQVQVQMPVPTETIVERDEATDVDGWVYGDNKWEGVGPKGGLGKFTRRRRWTRRAILVETITKLKPAEVPTTAVPPSVTTESALDMPTAGTQGPISPLKAKPAPAVSASEQARAKVSTSTGAQKGSGLGLGMGMGLANVEMSKTRSSSSEGQRDETHGVSASGTSTGSSTRDDVLRLRLKKAMGSVGG